MNFWSTSADIHFKEGVWIYLPTVPKSCLENLFCKMADSTTQNFKVKIHYKKPSLQEWRQKGVRRRRKFLLSDPSFIVRIPSGFCRWHTFLAFLARCGNHSVFLFGKSYPWEIFIFPPFFSLKLIQKIQLTQIVYMDRLDFNFSLGDQ